MSLSEQVRGVLSTTMSDASCAMTLGRSKTWVVRMRHEIATGGAPAVVVPEAAPIVMVEPMAEVLAAPEVQASVRTINRHCNPDAGQGVSPTAPQMAAALAFAARRLKSDPSQICMPGMANRKVRVLAGAGLRARLGTANTVLAALLGLHGPELAPSMVRAAGVTTDDLLSLSETLPARAAEDAPAVALIIERRPPALKTTKAPRAKAVKAAKLRPVLGKITDRVTVVAPLPTIAARGAPGVPLKDNLRVPGPARPSTPVRHSPAAATASRAATPGRPTNRFKPVTPQVARWAAWFADAQWDLEEVAGLFDVHPDGLVDALAASLHAGLSA